ASGRFQIPLRRPDACKLRVEARGFAPALRDKARPGTSLLFVLEKGGAIEGVVRDAAGGGPPAGGRGGAPPRGGGRRGPRARARSKPPATLRGGIASKDSDTKPTRSRPWRGATAARGGPTSSPALAPTSSCCPAPASAASSWGPTRSPCPAQSSASKRASSA